MRKIILIPIIVFSFFFIFASQALAAEWVDIVDDTRLTNDSASSYHPSIGVDSDGNVHIAWYDKRDGNNEIYYKKIDNHGNILVADTRLSHTSNNSFHPSLAVDSTGNIHIAWNEKTARYHNYYEIF